MLEWVTIKNLALIEKADIEFEDGFNVVTGETGAGKSVLLGTVSLLLGERADKSAIRTGEDRCELIAGIKLPAYLPQEFYTILSEAGIDLDPAEGSMQLKRIITHTRTRNFINDTPVTLQTLQAVGEYLIDVHGANEHQSLLKQSTQLTLLDRYSHNDKLIDACSEICDRIREVKNQREELMANLPSTVEAEHLRMVVEEISKIDPQPNEDDEISERHRLAASSKQIMELTSQAVAMINESDNSAIDFMSNIYRILSDLNGIDPDNTEKFLTSCDEITEMLNDLSNEVERYGSRVELDEEEFQQLEDRLSELQRLKRRYGPGLENVIEALEETQERLKRFDNSEKLRDELDHKETELNNELHKAAKKLSGQRQKTAVELSKAITDKLKTLGFLKCRMEIAFSGVAPGRNGMDRIDFIFAPNPGEEPQPLRNIASSGEISRVMLAVKTVLAEADAIPILVFDEIDANIGGETAVKVGNELRKLAAHRQILCISHLPQVASMGKTHFLVSKEVSDNRTTTSITRMNDTQRKQEITRMLGGGKAAANHAKELLDNRMI